MRDSGVKEQQLLFLQISPSGMGKRGAQGEGVEEGLTSLRCLFISLPCSYEEGLVIEELVWSGTYISHCIIHLHTTLHNACGSDSGSVTWLSVYPNNKGLDLDLSRDYIHWVFESNHYNNPRYTISIHASGYDHAIAHTKITIGLGAKRSKCISSSDSYGVPTICQTLY